MAESISEGTLKQWSKQVGDFVEQDEEIATIETDKASLPYLPFHRLGERGVKLISTSADRCRRQCSSSRHNKGVFRERGGYRCRWTRSRSSGARW